jgi:hypothetical protein
MGIDRPSPAVIAAIEGDIEWLRSAKLRGFHLNSKIQPFART